jgi:hypothetical protein
VLIPALVLAIGTSIYFAAQLWRVERSTSFSLTNWTPELTQLWSPLISSNRPLVICLSTPASNAAGLGTATFRLGEFLGPRKSDIQLTPSEQLSMPEISMGNVVVLGSPNRSRQLKALPLQEQIVLESGGIRNLNPRSGEPAFLADRVADDPQGSAETYALISRVASLGSNGEVLYFSGNETPSITGAVQALTDAKFAHTLVSRLKSSAGSLPRYYQVVVKVRSMDDMPIDYTYMFHRELSAK